MFYAKKKIIVHKINLNTRGNILLFVMVFGAISLSLITLGIASYGISENHASLYKANSEKAFQIAEAGVEYYRWHLAHNKNDYQDGTNQTGPYVHEYRNSSGQLIGHYSLNITPPATGSTVVTIASTGWVDIQPGSKRTIRIKVGFPAFTDYAFITNTSAVVGVSDVIHGKYHANGGIEFDGTADAPITSAVATYVCKKNKNNQGCSTNAAKPGIWGAGSPTSYWKFPVPAIDISAITPKLAQLKTGAQNGGLYLSSSGAQGWRLQFVNNGTINVYKVLTTLCYKGKDSPQSSNKWFCNDISTVAAPTNYPVPANGYIYVNDRTWVDGVVKGRATVATKDSQIMIISNNITYQAKDGTNALGLVGGTNVIISHDAPNDLEIDGVILARQGDAKRDYFQDSTKNSLSIYGSVIALKNWYWNWYDANNNKTSGYLNVALTYDANLAYNPPPGFPFGADYKLISWEEMK